MGGDAGGGAEGLGQSGLGGGESGSGGDGGGYVGGVMGDGGGGEGDGDGGSGLGWVGDRDTNVDCGGEDEANCGDVRGGGGKEIGGDVAGGVGDGCGRHGEGGGGDGCGGRGEGGGDGGGDFREREACCSMHAGMRHGEGTAPSLHHADPSQWKVLHQFGQGAHAGPSVPGAASAPRGSNIRSRVDVDNMRATRSCPRRSRCGSCARDMARHTPHERTRCVANMKQRIAPMAGAISQEKSDKSPQSFLKRIL